MNIKEIAKDIRKKMLAIINDDASYVVSIIMDIDASYMGMYEHVLMFNVIDDKSGEIKTVAYNTGISEAGFLVEADPKDVLAWFDSIIEAGKCIGIHTIQ